MGMGGGDGTEDGAAVGASRPRVFLDADACPVKDHVYRVGARFDIPVLVVAARRLTVPSRPNITAVAAGDEPDAADDWIAERAGPGDLVLTADLPLAARVLRAGAQALDFRGEPFDPNRMGDVLASRDLNAYLRSLGVATGGPSGYTPRDRSRFASRLDAMVRRLVAG